MVISSRWLSLSKQVGSTLIQAASSKTGEGVQSHRWKITNVEANLFYIIVLFAHRYIYVCIYVIISAKQADIWADNVGTQAKQIDIIFQKQNFFKFQKKFPRRATQGTLVRIQIKRRSISFEADKNKKGGLIQILRIMNLQ